MVDRIFENLYDLVTDLPELIFGLFTDNQEAIVVCIVIILSYWCFLQKN
jgi:hypothetical protein